MIKQTAEIRPFDRMGASDTEYEAVAALSNSVRLEALPDDPPTSVEQMKLELQNIPSIVELSMWVAWEDGWAVGRADVAVPHMETNNHLVQFNVAVASGSRRQGLGTRLLASLTPVARREGRRLMLATTRSTIPAGEAFLAAIGGEMGLATHMNQLEMADLNRDLVRSWQERAAERAAGFELVLWEGSYPTEELESIAAVKQAINTMPTDSLNVEEFRWTPEQLRQLDESLEAQGEVRWSMFARDRATGRYAGYTELYWNPAKATIAQQGDTAVLSEYKNRGLGRWLKAAMLDKLARERPGVERVRTGNAQSNAPMLKINEELGFRPAMTELLWQVETDKASAYCEQRGSAVPAA